jgi:acetyl-CoA carboxylase beta subunit
MCVLKINPVLTTKNYNKMEDKENNEVQSEVIVSCPKCNSSWIGDIGYNNAQCYLCDEVFPLKSKTGLEEK